MDEEEKRARYKEMLKEFKEKCEKDDRKNKENKWLLFFETHTLAL